MEKTHKNSKEITTNSGIPVEAIYKDHAATEDSLPGQYPFTRGIHESMYRGRLWTMRQYAGFGTAKESNERYRYLLAQGQTGLSIAFDLPTQLGLDPDNSRSKGEIGKVGVSIASIEDMHVLMDGINQESVSTSMTINATAGILLALYVAVAKEKGRDLKKLNGTVQNDLLKEYAARGNYIYPPKASIKLTTDIIEFCSNELPKWNPISISGYHIREAGSTAVQEVAFTLGNAICYVENAVKRGLKVDEFAPRLSFFWNVHNEFFEEVAKFRAARRIWARIMKERFGAIAPNSMKLRFHAQTAGVTLTAQQPQNNIVRVAYQAMAAVLGGCQSLHTNGFDEALALPTEQSAKLALRTQQILGFETGVCKTPDPVGGSFVETLTDEIEAQVLDYLKGIDEKGGMVACIENGYIQSEISGSAYSQQKLVENGELKVVGVNCFADEASLNGSLATSTSSKSEGADKSDLPKLLRISEELGAQRVLELKTMRSKRDTAKVTKALAELKEAARLDQNTMPIILKAIEARATLGEVSDIFREVYGTQTEWAGI